MKSASSEAFSPRLWRASGIATVTIAATMLALVGCSSGGESASAPENTVSQGEYPSYYPDDYDSLVEAAEAEGGNLVIYSNTDQENWTPIFRDFQKKYPFVKSIDANNLDSDEVFQRQLSEMATGSAPADVLVSNAVQAWATYAERDNVLMEYASPELAELPDFAELLPNVHAMSLDPVGMLYNTDVIDTPLESISDLAELVAADPAKFKNKITTRDVTGAWGFTVSHAWAGESSDDWEVLKTTLAVARPETSSGTQKDKLLSGEYGAGFLISSAVGYPAEDQGAGLVKFVLPKDGTVVLGRGIGITPDAPHAATAKLFVDFLLSEEGQNAVAEGGLSSYRDSVELVPGLHTYQEVVATVGEDAVIRVPYEVVSEDEVKSFVTKWDGLLG